MKQNKGAMQEDDVATKLNAETGDPPSQDTRDHASVLAWEPGCLFYFAGQVLLAIAIFNTLCGIAESLISKLMHEVVCLLRTVRKNW